MIKYKVIIVALATVVFMSGCGSASEPSPARETSAPVNVPTLNQEDYPDPFATTPPELESYPEPIQPEFPTQESYPTP